MNPQPVSLADELRKLPKMEAPLGEDTGVDWVPLGEALALLDQHAVAEPGELFNAAEGLLKYVWEVNYLDEVETDYERAIVRLRNALLAAQPELPAPAHAAEQPKENWKPVRGQYVWVEGKLTENQPETFPKKLRVYVHGVGTGIAENVRPVTETAAEQPKLTEEQVREALLTCVRDISKLQGLLREKHGKCFTIPCSTGKMRAENVLHLLTSPVAPPAQTSQAYPGQKYFHDHNANIKRAELNAAPPVAPPPQQDGTVARALKAICDDLDQRLGDAPPVAPGEQPPQIKKEEIMKSADLMQTTDHVVWAREFVQRYGGDEELMASWFASAMMAMHDKMHGPPNGDAMQYKLDQHKPPVEPARKCVYCGELQPEKLSAAGIIEAIEGKVEQRELNDLLESIAPGDLPPNISELHGLLLSLDRLLTDPHPGLMTWREQYEKASKAILAFYEVNLPTVSPLIVGFDAPPAQERASDELLSDLTIAVGCIILWCNREISDLDRDGYLSEAKQKLQSIKRKLAAQSSPQKKEKL